MDECTAAINVGYTDKLHSESMKLDSMLKVATQKSSLDILHSLAQKEQQARCAPQENEHSYMNSYNR